MKCNEITGIFFTLKLTGMKKKLLGKIKDVIFLKEIQLLFFSSVITRKMREKTWILFCWCNSYFIQYTKMALEV